MDLLVPRDEGRSLTSILTNFKRTQMAVKEKSRLELEEALQVFSKLTAGLQEGIFPGEERPVGTT